MFFYQEIEFKRILEIHEKYYVGKSARTNVESVFEDLDDVDFKQTWRTDSKGYLDGFAADDDQINKYLNIMIPKLENI